MTNLDSFPSAAGVGVLLTLITPTYNRARFLDETLTCVRAQWRSELELIVVDDASTDGTLEYLAKRWPSIKVLHLQERSGPSVARNAALSHASGRYVMSLDSDCLLPPGTVDYLLEFIQSRPLGVYLFPCRSWPKGCPSTLLAEEREVELEHLLLKSLGEVIPLIPSRYLEDSGLRFPPHFAGGEPYLLLQMSLRYPIRFVGKVIQEYRTDTPMRISSPEYQVKFPGEIAEVLEATLPFYAFCDSRVARSHYLLTLQKIGIYSLLAGESRRGRTFLKRSLLGGRLSSGLFLLVSILPVAVLKRLYLWARRLVRSR